MCQKKNCYVSPCTCCSSCYCDYTCYDCFDVKYNYLSCTNREDHNSSDIRHKFVCFPCRRVWKSYTNKYIWLLANDKSNDLSDYVPNICSPSLSNEEKQKQRQKYLTSRGDTAWGAKFVTQGKVSKCAKCGNEGMSVGRNFRHCKTEKDWNEMERKVKNGEIDLQKDFRNYPREGTQEYKAKLMATLTGNRR